MGIAQARADIRHRHLGDELHFAALEVRLATTRQERAVALTSLRATATEATASADGWLRAEARRLVEEFESEGGPRTHGSARASLDVAAVRPTTGAPASGVREVLGGASEGAGDGATSATFHGNRRAS